MTNTPSTPRRSIPEASSTGLPLSRTGVVLSLGTWTHARVFAGSGHAAEELALLGLAGDNRLSGDAAFEHDLAHVQPHLAEPLLLAVAGGAGAVEDRFDVAGEVDSGGG